MVQDQQVVGIAISVLILIFGLRVNKGVWAVAINYSTEWVMFNLALLIIIWYGRIFRDLEIEI
jgi:hypothetical protein